MRSFKDTSIRWKLTLVITLTSGIALLLACAAMYMHESVVYKRSIANNTETLADIIGRNSCAAIIFGDTDAAHETLSALGAEEHVVSACIYDRTGNLLAEYARPGNGSGHADSLDPKKAVYSGYQIVGDNLIMLRRIRFQEENIGAIYLESDMSQVYVRLRQYAWIIGAFMLASSFIALLLSSKVQRVVTDPILRLASLANTVSEEKNYSVRAAKEGDDEIGSLIDSFNDMLEQIQARDGALLEAHNDLERRVEQRTEELQQEIAERKRAEEALRLTQFSVDVAAVATLWVDSEGRILNVNQAGCIQMGYTRDELLKMTIFDINPRHTKETWSTHWSELKTRRSLTMEDTHRRRDGREFPVELTLNYLEFNGHEYNFAFIRDITERKRVEAELLTAKENAEAASKAKSEFLANMSHEIRTPMNGIIGMTELALDTELQPEQREYLDAVRSSADSLLAIINDILDFSKIEAGRFELDTVEFDLRDQVCETLDTLALRAHEKGLELACHILSDVPDALMGDSRRLRQVIVNLVGNAIKFTETGEVVVRVEVQSQSKGEVFLHFAVSDTGIGIPKIKQKVIFEAFAQADGSTTRRYGGTGLGLAISMQLVEMMGGHLWLESEEGVGSTFHFTTRFQLQEMASRQATAPNPEAIEGVPVLVCDDNATNRRILSDMLTNWKMKPTVVDNGPAALAAMSEAQRKGRPFVLLILDANMPEMDGFTVAERIQEMPDLSLSTTMMMLTSAGQHGDVHRAKAAGIASYLVKPVRQSELLNAILTLLDTDDQQNSPVSETNKDDGDKIRPLLVLVAEDNPVNQKVTTRILEKQGHTPVVVGDGSAALSALEKQTFDLVLMDVQMPVMDGLEATRTIREKEQETGTHIPIIAMTAHAMKGDKERCLGAGMDSYVSKPVHPEELFSAIKELTVTNPEVESSSPKQVGKPMDMNAALARLEGDMALLQEISGLFLDTYPDLLSAVKNAVDTGNSEDLTAAAHAIKGTVGNFAAKAAHEAALALEMMGRKGKMEHAQEAYSRLECEVRSLAEYLATLCMEEAA